VLGVLLFGWLTDRFGRKRLFFITLTVYLLATTATAFSRITCRAIMSAFGTKRTCKPR
jgi:MFS family permease